MGGTEKGDRKRGQKKGTEKGDFICEKNSHKNAQARIVEDSD